MLSATSFIVLLPGETAPTTSCNDSFVFRSVLGVYCMMPTSLRLNFWNWSGSPFFILLNTREFFFSAFSFIRMLLIASGTDFNFFVICVDLWAVIQASTTIQPQNIVWVTEVEWYVSVSLHKFEIYISPLLVFFFVSSVSLCVEILNFRVSFFGYILVWLLHHFWLL